MKKNSSVSKFLPVLFGFFIMGVAGGDIIPLIMGITSDVLGQIGMSVLLIALAYLLFNAIKMYSKTALAFNQQAYSLLTLTSDMIIL